MDNETTAGHAATRREDGLLGRLLVEKNGIPVDRVNECLRLQKEAASRGAKDIPRLGELLVAKGYVPPEMVVRVLALQRKTIVQCCSCRRRYNVLGFDPAKVHRCRSCQGTLTPVAALDTIQVEESGRIPFIKTVVQDGSAKPPSPLPQSPLGKYTILREIGRGGMGIVYEALDGETKNHVALKMMLAGQSSNEDEQRFIREARLSANLPRHPNVVSVYEAGVIECRRYLSMEFIKGTPMSKWQKRGEATLRQKVEVIRDVALAVNHAHRHNVIHRDLKPENILIDQEGRPHVTDFGLAKSVGQDVSVSLTSTGVVMGTPAYMSPEQAQGLKIMDGRTDIYSIGVVLYETLAGCLPFTGENAVEIGGGVAENNRLPTRIPVTHFVVAFPIGVFGFEPGRGTGLPA